MAGILMSLTARFGRTLANEIARTEGTLCSEEVPNGHGLRRDKRE